MQFINYLNTQEIYLCRFVLTYTLGLIRVIIGLIWTTKYRYYTEIQLLFLRLHYKWVGLLGDITLN